MDTNKSNILIQQKIGNKITTNNEVSVVKKTGLGRCLDYECGEDAACKSKFITEMVQEGGRAYDEHNAKVLVPDISTIAILVGILFAVISIILLKGRYCKDKGS